MLRKIVDIETQKSANMFSKNRNGSLRLKGLVGQTSRDTRLSETAVSGLYWRLREHLRRYPIFDFGGLKRDEPITPMKILFDRVHRGGTTPEQNELIEIERITRIIMGQKFRYVERLAVSDPKQLDQKPVASTSETSEHASTRSQSCLSPARETRQRRKTPAPMSRAIAGRRALFLSMSASPIRDGPSFDTSGNCSCDFRSAPTQTSKPERLLSHATRLAVMVRPCPCPGASSIKPQPASLRLCLTVSGH
ncbi:MAG: hypothetical protein HC788_09785 [Sphingopyxis sp.]|nr:hypothetical protein [Sphingopyxis sp.]